MTRKQKPQYWIIGLLVGILIICTNLPSSSALTSGEVIFPADSGYVNLKSRYGARGDGKTDDTQAFQQAIQDNVRLLYLPKGTYLVSDELKFWPKRWQIQGQNREKTIIKLKDNCPGFSDINLPKAVISTYRMTPGEGNMGQGFRASIYNLTVDIGKGNSGAVGLHWLNNNQGTVRDVTIISSDPQHRGKAGLASVTNWPGPGLVKNVRIEGFDYGIWAQGGQFSLVYEHIFLKDQRKAGIYEPGQIMTIRDLKSYNSVPAIQHQSYASLLTLIDAELNGGASDAIAIESWPVLAPGREKDKNWIDREGPGLLVRNLKTEGYKLALRSVVAQKTTDVPGPFIKEFTSHPVASQFPTPLQTLNLSVEETPEFPLDKLDDWVSITEFGAKPIKSNEKSEEIFDNTQAIQKAIDSGKPTVYFPHGKYGIKGTIHIRGNVRRIIGMESRLRGLTDDLPLFQIEGGNSQVIVFERMEPDYQSTTKFWFEHASSRTLVLRNMGTRGYRNTVSGRLFIEDVVGDPWHFEKQRVWARQMNPESRVETNIINNGSTLWILNLKTEGGKTIIDTKNNGKTEVLGGYLYANRGAKDRTAFLNNNSSVSLTYVNKNVYPEQIKEIRNGETRIISPDNMPKSKYSTKVPLYVGYAQKLGSKPIKKGMEVSSSSTSHHCSIQQKILSFIGLN